jgi:hypothetical protein
MVMHGDYLPINIFLFLKRGKKGLKDMCSERVGGGEGEGVGRKNVKPI